MYLDGDDEVLTEIKSCIMELKRQVAAEESKLNQLESLVTAGASYSDVNDYSSPAWFASH